MGKRFIASELWEKAWFRKLSPRLKAFWFYLITKCDCAGVWEPDFELASFVLGEEVTESDLNAFGDRIFRLPNGKFILNTFIKFQYGTLSHKCKPHTAVIKALRKNFIPITERVIKGLLNPMPTLEEEEKEKEPYKEEEREEGED